jgi:8-oxo-dGTP pyrophosphatase MutT (NUDIX family)
MFVIPIENLPPGFGERLERPPADPAPVRPAATIVLLRDGDGGPEALLLKRLHSAGFVPGAYVFPGGRVDPSDADPRLLAHASGLTPETDPEPMYWVAALRELFEEAGVLLARNVAGEPLPCAGNDARLARAREALLEEEAPLLEVLDSLEAELALSEVVYFAHWITPVAEARRYDTRFFLARLPAGCEAKADPRETAEALWLTPADALARFRDGRLPMVFPTVSTLEAFAGFDSAEEALAAFRGRPVTPILPRLVRTERGVGIVVDGR